MPEPHASRGARRGRRQLVSLGDEIRAARLAAGLSLAVVAAAAGNSTAELSRIERGLAPWLDLLTAARVCAVVGLDLSVRAYAGGDPVRDVAHARLFDSFLGELGPGVRVRAEVPIGEARDKRAWDAVVDDGSSRVAAELETRLTDVQAFMRRISLKLRDSGIGTVLLVLPATRANRLAVRAADSVFRVEFPLGSDAIRAALRSGRVPAASGILFVSTPRGRAHSHGARAADRSDGRATGIARPTQEP